MNYYLFNSNINEHCIPAEHIAMSSVNHYLCSSNKIVIPLCGGKGLKYSSLNNQTNVH